MKILEDIIFEDGEESGSDIFWVDSGFGSWDVI